MRKELKQEIKNMNEGTSEKKSGGKIGGWRGRGKKYHPYKNISMNSDVLECNYVLYFSPSEYSSLQLSQLTSFITLSSLTTVSFVIYVT